MNNLVELKNPHWILVGIWLLVPALMNAQATKGDFSSRSFSQSLFKHALENGIDTSERLSWVFEFANSDSVVLATLMRHFVEKQKGLKIGDITVGTSKDNSPRRKLEGLYIIEIQQDGVLTQKLLLEKIQNFQKIFKKSPIELVGIGYLVTNYNNNKTNENLATISKIDTLEEQNSTDTNFKKLIDSKTKNPIPYASIGIPSAEIGDISRLDGIFELTVPDKYKRDTIIISSLGYKTLKISVIAFEKQREFHLTPEARVLDEVKIIAKASNKTIELGVKNVKGNSLGFIQGKGAGAEAARLMKYNRKVPLYLNEVSIYVENTAEQSIQLLVNIYTQDSITGLPHRNLLRQTVLIKSDIKEGWLDVNLNDEQIKVNQPFFVSFQWIDSNTKNPFIALKGNSGYQRAISMGKWIESSTFSWAIKVKGTILE